MARPLSSRAKGALVVALLALGISAVAVIPMALAPRQAQSQSTVTSEQASSDTTPVSHTTASSSAASAVSNATSSASSSAGRKMSIETDSSALTSDESMIIRGSVSPTPTAASNVTITIASPQGVVVVANSPVSTTNGSYSYQLVTGGSADGWVTGKYTVTGDWAGSGETATATTSFEFENVFLP